MGIILTKKIRNTIESNGPNKLYMVQNFACLNNEGLVTCALSRLEKESVLIRLSQGIYLYPSRNKVRFLKTNSGKKGEGMPVVRNPQFYFREGFCWIDVNSTYLKARIKANGIFDVLSMSLFTMTTLPDWYFVALINSEFISLYVDNFINNTSHFQINDARQLPIIIPKKETFESLQKLVANCISLKKTTTTDDFLMGEKQYELDRLVRLLYRVED